MAMHDEGLGHPFDDPLGEHLGPLRLLRSDLNDGELVAAEPGDGVLIGEASCDAGGDGLQERVPHRVAERVIDGFELVEIETQDGERCALFADPGERRVVRSRSSTRFGSPVRASWRAIWAMCFSTCLRA